MKLEVKPVNKMNDGSYNGTIVSVSYRDTPFNYTDIGVEFENKAIFKYGVPTVLTIESKLGKLLSKFGCELEEGLTIDPEVILIGKKCKCMIMNTTSAKGTFANIVKDSLVPVK